jgi:CubicO group peptidase (beta-lactamase class C family)
MRLIDYSCFAGSSVFISTPSDLVRFGMAILDGKLLKPATVKLLQTTHQADYGLGWQVRSIDLAGKPTPAIGHDGDVMGGMVASLMTLPEYGIVVAVTSNISFADTAAVAESVARTFAAQGIQ